MWHGVGIFTGTVHQHPQAPERWKSPGQVARRQNSPKRPCRTGNQLDVEALKREYARSGIQDSKGRWINREGRMGAEMSLDSISTIIQQSVAIIITIVLLYLVQSWVTRSLRFEEQKKASLNIARQVRRRAFQKSVALLQDEAPFFGRIASEQGKLEEQDGIK